MTPTLHISKLVQLATCQKQVVPKVIWEKRIATRRGREWTRLLHVLLVVQYLYTHTQPFYGSLDSVWDNGQTG